jgi:hypothetical protein
MQRVSARAEWGGGRARNLALLIAVAAWGEAAGITMATLFVGEPHGGQLPGNMLLRGLDARGPLLAIEAVILAPLLALLVARPLIRRAAFDAQAKRWAFIAATLALLGGDWLVLADPFETAAILFCPPLLALLFLAMRRYELPRRVPLPSRRLRAYLVYPMFALAVGYASMPSMPPRVNLFEDGHSFMPASEMLHGKVPYRDLVPGHGLIADGLFDYTMIRLGARNVGAVLHARALIAALLPLAVYLAALGVTGSAEGALAALIVAACLTLTGTPWARPVSALEAIPPLRAIPSFLVLGAASAALRLRSRRWLMLAGALTVLAGFMSVEFGVYALVTSIVAALRFSRTRKGVMRGFGALAAGLFGAAIIPLIALLATGAFVPFLRVTFVEIPPLIDAYAIGYYTFPPAHESMRGFPEIFAAFFTPRMVWLVSWLAVLLSTSVAIAGSVKRRRAVDPIIAAGCWTIVAALSFAERTNVYFMPAAVIVAVAWIVRWTRDGHVRAALAASAVLLVIAAPTARLRRAPAREELVAYAALPRAAGGLYTRDNAASLAVAQTFVEHALRPDETFFDFANMPMLYYLLDRRAPIRQYETPFYETEDLQREVIARLERDRSVRAALMQFPNEGATSIDGVPNAMRAPLVHRYLVGHFRPAYAQRGVVFWVRQ